ncbi:MAG TPA: hypothetical protein VHI52_02320, partial [Verrucomicrobiae bacterium]|nr:hypothetical protein [Verrucomicrobiae bacterium]
MESTEILKRYHDEQASRGIAILSELDWTIACQQSGLDPNTGVRPPAEKERTSLQQRVEQEQSDLLARFEKLIDTYAGIFGQMTAEYFRTAIRIWHLGGTVITPVPPAGRPTQEAIDSAQFGREEDGRPVNPGEEEVAAITDELADHLRDVNDPKLRQALLEKYSADFGAPASTALEQWCREINQVEENGIDELEYDPGHPWHYSRKGDGAEPMAVDEIP